MRPPAFPRKIHKRYFMCSSIPFCIRAAFAANRQLVAVKEALAADLADSGRDRDLTQILAVAKSTIAQMCTAWRDIYILQIFAGAEGTGVNDPD